MSHPIHLIPLPTAELYWSLYGVPGQIENNDTGRDALLCVRDQGGAAAHALPPQDLRARGEIKWKHAMHLMRLLLSGISALREGELRVRLDEERDALRLHKEFDEAFASTRLPKRPDYAWANEFLLKVRRSTVNR